MSATIHITASSGWRICTKCAAVYGIMKGTPDRCAVSETPHTPGATALMMVDASTVGFPNLQTGWKWCSRCKCVYFGGNATQGVCSWGGAHSGTANLAFYQGAFFHNVKIAGISVDGFRWCRKCEEMGYKPLMSKCPAGGAHDYSQSGTYALTPWIV